LLAHIPTRRAFREDTVSETAVQRSGVGQRDSHVALKDVDLDGFV
jgi:hypothetical protein